MLLKEITLDTSQIKRRTPGKVLGSGVQGMALSTNKTNTVRKIYGLDNLQDPYYQFIHLIQQHQDNPFFPRIYRHNVYKNKPLTQSGSIKYNMTGVVMMEKLQPLDKVDSKLPNEVIFSMFANLGINLHDLIDLYGFFEDRHAIQHIINITPNEKFAEALRVLTSSGRKAYDLHSGNWMVRLTSVGPQIVILDPVYGSDINSLSLDALEDVGSEIE